MPSLLFFLRFSSVSLRCTYILLSFAFFMQFLMLFTSLYFSYPSGLNLCFLCSLLLLHDSRIWQDTKTCELTFKPFSQFWSMSSMSERPQWDDWRNKKVVGLLTGGDTHSDWLHDLAITVLQGGGGGNGIWILAEWHSCTSAHVCIVAYEGADVFPSGSLATGLWCGMDKCCGC